MQLLRVLRAADLSASVHGVRDGGKLEEKWVLISDAIRHANCKSENLFAFIFFFLLFPRNSLVAFVSFIYRRYKKKRQCVSKGRPAHCETLTRSLSCIVSFHHTLFYPLCTPVQVGKWVFGSFSDWLLLKQMNVATTRKVMTLISSCLASISLFFVPSTTKDALATGLFAFAMFLQGGQNAGIDIAVADLFEEHVRTPSL